MLRIEQILADLTSALVWIFFDLTCIDFTSTPVYLFFKLKTKLKNKQVQSSNPNKSERKKNPYKSDRQIR